MSTVTKLPSAQQVEAIRSEASQAAVEVLGTHWDGKFPVDPIAIARALGADVFTAELGNDVSGLITAQDQDGASIYLDADQPEPRMRFTCAHEIGHMVEHDKHDPEDVVIDYVDKRSEGEAGKPAEIWANHFAGVLLMPEQALRQEHARGLSEVRLAAHFGVSLPALRYRMYLLEMV